MFLAVQFAILQVVGATPAVEPLESAYPTPCKTLHRWNDWMERRLNLHSVHRTTLEHIDAFSIPEDQIHYTEHFAIHWGTEAPTTTRLEDIAEVLELSWSRMVDDWAMNPPVDGMFFNVYIGGTGTGVPDDFGVAGYYDVDSNGYPMVVLGRYLLDSWSVAKTTIPHEFFHAMQHRTGSYRSFDDRWYWEATATWVEQELFPGHPAHADFLFGYAFQPHLPLSYFEIFSTGAIEEYHAYGAFIFPQFLTDFYVDTIEVIDSWSAETGGEDRVPLQWWLEYSSENEVDFGVWLSEMSAHNAYWDYPNQLIYQTQLDAYANRYPTDDQRIAKSLFVPLKASQQQTEPVDVEVLEIEHSVDSELRPGAYGYNHWSIVFEQGWDSTDSVEIYFDGATKGDFFSSVDWKVQVVRYWDGAPVQEAITYSLVDIQDGEGAFEIAEILSNEEVRLSIFADVQSFDVSVDERFAYTLKIVAPHLVEEEESKRACSSVAPSIGRSRSSSSETASQIMGKLLWSFEPVDFLRQVLPTWWVPVVGLLRLRRRKDRAQ